MEPSSYFVAELHTDNFLTEAILEGNYESEDYSHRLILKFSEPVRNGNNISHLNISSEGQVVAQEELFTGETSFSLDLNPGFWELEIVVVDTDGNVYAMDRVEITDVQLDE